MNIDQLRYFADLAKTGSMNTTAKRMFISQPALSESVKRLEEELGCPLLIRSKTGITFTEDGKMVLEHALHILEHHAQIQQKLLLKYHNEHLHGQLTIGVGTTINDTFLPDLLLKMHQAYPQIALAVLETEQDSLFPLLNDKIIDIGLVGFSKAYSTEFARTFMQEQEIYHIQKLFTDPMVCVMEKSHPLAMYDILNREQISAYKQTVYGSDATFISSIGAMHISTNAKTHQQFMKTIGAVCMMPRQAFLSLYPAEQFVCKPVIDAEPVTIYLVCRRQAQEQQPDLYQTFINTVLSIIPISNE